MNRIREMREAAKMNQRQLAEKTHIPQSLLSNLEREVRQPWPAAAKKIARALKTPVAELFPNLGK